MSVARWKAATVVLSMALLLTAGSTVGTEAAESREDAPGLALVTPKHQLSRRAFDSRGGTTLVAGAWHRIDLGLDPTAGAAWVTVTSVGGDRAGYVSLGPMGVRPPSTSALAFEGLEPVANTLIVPVSAGGLHAWVSTPTHLVIDVRAVFAETSSRAGRFHNGPVVRVGDTRVPLPYPVEPGAVTGYGLLSTLGTGLVSATAMVFNVTGLDATRRGYVSVGGVLLQCGYNGGSGGYQCADSAFLSIDPHPVLHRPVAPATATVITPPLAWVHIASTAGPVEIVTDFVGWFGDGHETETGALLYPIEPVRVCDTRTAASGGCEAGPLAAGVTRPIDLSSYVDPSASAVVVNVTTTDSTQLAFLDAGSEPSSCLAIMHALPDRPVSQGTVIPITNATLELTLQAGGTDVVIDLLGYFKP